MSTATVPAPGQPPVSKNRLLVTSGLGWMSDAMDVGLLSFILAALKLDWGLTAGQMGWLGAVNSIGMAVGAVMFGMMADRIGRKHVFVITLLLFAIATRRLPLSMMAFLQYLAPTLAFLIGVLMYHEPLDTLRMLSLAAIWTGLAVYSVDLVKAAAARQEVPLP